MENNHIDYCFVTKDNFLDVDLIKFLNYYFLKIPHSYGVSSNGLDKGHSFYYSELNIKDPLVEFLCRKIQKEIRTTVGFIRVYINVHYNGMPGDYHKDDGDMTAVLMVSKTLQPGSGQFKVKIDNDENKINSIDFVQNRLILFPAKWEHRGLDPIELATPRITLAFKTQMV
jgi:hypothetical protein